MSIFPLPLSPFEEYMLCDDRPSHPMDFYIRLRFEGKLDFGPLSRAYAHAIEQHPLLRASVAKVRNTYQWSLPLSKSSRIPIELSEANGYATESCGRFHNHSQPRFISPLLGPPQQIIHSNVQCYPTVAEDRTELLFQFHHSATDATGGLFFITDLFKAYQQISDGIEPSAATYDDQHLSRRGRYLQNWSSLLKILPKQVIGLQGAVQFLTRRPTSIFPEKGLPEAKKYNEPGLISACLNDDITVRLIEFAQKKRVTVNDVLTRDLFIATERFRASKGLLAPEKWLRISIPVNLRARGAQPCSAANIVSMVFLDRQNILKADPELLLRSIHDEMDLIKRNQLGLTFVWSLAIQRNLPGGLAGAVRVDRCLASLVLSNLGIVFPAADDRDSPGLRRDSSGRINLAGAMLDNFELFPPVRPWQAAALGINTYAGRVHVACRFDRNVMDDEEASAFLNHYVAELQQTAEKAR